MKSTVRKSGLARQMQNVSDGSTMSEQELSEWAEKSAFLANEGYGVFCFGTAIFWSVIAAILIARFFLIDPTKLRPVSASAPQSAISMLVGGQV